MAAETTLELKIISNATTAVKALTALASAMERVRKATSAGLGLQVVVRDIRDLTRAVEDSQASGTANYLIKLAEALDKISKVRGVKLPNLDDLTKGAGNPEAATNVNNMANALAKYESTVARVGRTIHQQTGPSAYAKQFVEASREMTRAETIFDEAFARRFTYQEKLNSGERAALPAPGQMQSSPLNDWRDYMENTMNEVVNSYEMGALRIQQALMFSTQGMQNAYRVFSEDFAQRWTYIQMLNGQTGEQKQLPGGINWGAPIKNATGWGGSSGQPPIPPSGMGGNGGSGGIDNGGFAQYEADVRQTNATVQDCTASLKAMFQAIKDGVAATRPAGSQLVGLFRSIGRIAFNRIIRGAIMAISKAFKEGLENVRAYHKAIGSDLNNALESASNATFKMKNSLGAALAPMIRSLLPMLQMLVSWVITAANVLNQFFALLNGAATWTRATDAAASSLDKVKASAGGAGGAVKNLLADWDELNVIQSQGGGGGGGGGGYLPLDYESLFEEVEVFDKRIRNIVDFIRDNFDNILSAAKRIGAAILLWDVSKAFGGIVAWLGGIAAEGLVLSVVFSFTRMFDDKYLETGEPGWLIADWITTGLGAVIGGKILKGLVDPKNAAVAVDVAAIITLGISAFASLVSYVTSIDNSALSKENLTLLLSGAGKMGLGAGLAAFRWLVPLSGKTKFGAKLWNSVAVAFAATLLTFGVGVGIKAMARMVAGEDWTYDNIRDIAIMSIAAGGSVGILGNRIFGLGGIESLESGAAAVLFAVSVGVGIKAVAEGINEGWTGDTIRDAVISVLAGAFGAAFVAHLWGATIGTIALSSVIGAAAVAVTIGLAIVLGNKGKDTVEWGDVTLTEQEVQAFVQQKMFKADIMATLSVVADKIEVSAAQQKQIKEDLALFVGDMKVINLGIATDQDFTQADADVQALMDHVSEYIEGAKALGKLTLAYTPTIVGSTKDEQGKWYIDYTQGWDEVNKVYSAAGAELGRILTSSERDQIIAERPNLVATLMQQISDVTNAIAQAQINAEAYAAMRLNLGDLSKKSFDDVIDEFDKYRKEIEDRYRGQIIRQYALQKELVDSLAVSSPGSDLYYKNKAILDDMERDNGQWLEDQVQMYVEAAMEPGRAMARAFAMSQYGIRGLPEYDLDTTAGKKWRKTISDNAVIYEKYSEDWFRYVAALATKIPKKVFDTTGTTGWELMSQELQEYLIRTFVNEDEWEQFESMLLEDVPNIGELYYRIFGGGLQGAQTPQVPETLEETASSMEDVTNAAGEAVTAVDDVIGKMRELASAETGISVEDLKAMNTTGWEYLTLDRADELIESVFPAEQWGYVMTILANLTNGGVGSKVGQSFVGAIQELPATASAAMADTKTAIEDTTFTVATPDTTSFNQTLNTMASNAALTVATINNLLSGYSMSFTPGVGADSIINRDMFKVLRKANGGFVTTGQMFIAREAGPEMVGSIGGRTAVANNDQIVAGIAGGVAAGQGEQNNLLRQQNEYLRMLLAKESTIKVEPSSGWGKFNRQSERMYAHNAGV